MNIFLVMAVNLPTFGIITRAEFGFLNVGAKLDLFMADQDCMYPNSTKFLDRKKLDVKKGSFQRIKSRIVGYFAQLSRVLDEQHPGF